MGKSFGAVCKLMLHAGMLVGALALFGVGFSLFAQWWLR